MHILVLIVCINKLILEFSFLKEFPAICFIIKLYYSSACFPDLLNRSKVEGKILVCLRDDATSFQYSEFAAMSGAAGVILANSDNLGYEAVSKPYLIAASLVISRDADSIFAYIKSTRYLSFFLFT